MIALCTALAAVKPVLHAQNGGRYTFTTLQLTAPARAAAMGGSYLAMRDGDLALCLANPSLLDSAVHGDIALGYINYFSDVNYGYVAYAHRLKPRLTLAGNVLFLSYGKFDTTDELGEVTGQFGAGETITTASAAWAIDSLFSVGASLRMLYGNIAGAYTLGVSADVAATYHKPSKNFCASLVFRNMGRQVTTYTTTQRDTLPFEIQLAVSKRLAHAPFIFHLAGENLQQWDLVDEGNNSSSIDPLTGQPVARKSWEFGDKLMRHLVVGSEFIISKNLRLQVGYNYRRRQELQVAGRPGTAGFSYGFGFRVKKFNLSYGRNIYHLAGPSNHFSISTSTTFWTK